MAYLFDILLAKNLAGGGVQPQGEIEITENGEYDVTEYASANVNVPSPFPVTVTFMNGTEEWAKVGVDGEGKIAEPTEPTVPIGYTSFNGWFDNNTKIAFPYKPESNKVLSAKYKNLPVDYQPVEYIQNTNTSYIKTDYIPQEGDVLIVDFQLTSVTRNPVFAGCANTGSGSTNRFLIGQQGSAEGYHYQAADKNWINSNVVADTDRHTIMFDTQTGMLYLDDNVIKEFVPSFGTVNYPMAIFTKYFGSTSYLDDLFMLGKIYSVKVKNSGIPTATYTPCYRTSDRVIGMYDEIAEQFYSNAGTGTFIKGEDI